MTVKKWQIFRHNYRIELGLVFCWAKNKRLKELFVWYHFWLVFLPRIHNEYYEWYSLDFRVLKKFLFQRNGSLFWGISFRVLVLSQAFVSYSRPSQTFQFLIQNSWIGKSFSTCVGMQMPLESHSLKAPHTFFLGQQKDHLSKFSRRFASVVACSWRWFCIF